MSKAKKPRLGRGLSSLMSMPVSIDPPVSPAEKLAQTAEKGAGRPDGASQEIQTPRESEQATAAPDRVGQTPSPPSASALGHGLTYLALETIQANPHQPRQAFDPAALQRLADSIKQDGLMQPIVVRPRNGAAPRPRKLPDVASTTSKHTTENHRAYEIVAGERRWRAAQLAGLTQLPAIIRDLSDQQMAEWALIENLQREDLNPIERAEAFRGLIQQFGLSHEQVADRVGVERPTITNSLRLLDLQIDIQRMIRDNLLSAGHAKAIGGIREPASQLALARRAVAGGWSVRMVEAAVKRMSDSADPTPAAARRVTRSAHVADLEQQIAAQLKTKVHIKTGRRKGSGTLSIEFYNLDQFDDLLGKLGVRLD